MRDLLRRHPLRAETALGIAVVLAFVTWTLRGGEPAVVSGLSGVRGPLYGAIAAVAGALLGFVIATVAILIALVNTDNERMKFMRNAAAYPMIWTIFTSTIRWMGGATAVSLAALLLDHEQGVIPDPWVELLRALVVLTSVVASLRLLTAMWILERIVELVNKPLPDRPAHGP